MNEAELLLEYRPWLRSVARNLLSYRDNRHAEDLAQEGWIAMWKHLPNLSKYNTPVDFQMKQAALRRMRVVKANLLREGGSSRGKRADAPDASVLLTDWQELDWDALAITQADLDLIYHSGQITQALNTLTAEQREYVFLQFYAYRGPKGLGAVNPLIRERWTPAKANTIWEAVKRKLRAELEHLRGCYD